MPLITTILFSLLLIIGIIWPTTSSPRQIGRGMVPRKHGLAEEMVKVSSLAEVISLRGGAKKSWLSKIIDPIKKFISFLIPIKSKPKYPSLKKKISKTDTTNNARKGSFAKSKKSSPSTTTSSSSSSSGLSRLQRVSYLS